MELTHQTERGTSVKICIIDGVMLLSWDFGIIFAVSFTIRTDSLMMNGGIRLLIMFGTSSVFFATVR